MTDRSQIKVRDITSPTHITRVDHAKYQAMRAALLEVVPSGPPA